MNVSFSNVSPGIDTSSWEHRRSCSENFVWYFVCSHAEHDALFFFFFWCSTVWNPVRNHFSFPLNSLVHSCFLILVSSLLLLLIIIITTTLFLLLLLLRFFSATCIHLLSSFFCLWKIRLINPATWLKSEITCSLFFSSPLCLTNISRYVELDTLLDDWIENLLCCSWCNRGRCNDFFKCFNAFETDVKYIQCPEKLLLK